jgi:phosphoribosylformylglycinamidine cyclo-ligase
MENGKLSYRGVGIDISRTDQVKRDMAAALETPDGRVLNKIGAFASLYDLENLNGIEHPVLVLKAEEPGSKQKLAFDFGYEGSVCHDMINHLVNDIIVMGAKPLAVLDVIITGGINESVIGLLVREMSAACKNNGCSLVGGETSIQPGVVSDKLCVLSASIAGVADKNKIIDGSRIRAGDVVLAAASNGLHTNGYTIVRKMMDMDAGLTRRQLTDGRTFLQCVMEPHTAYYPALKDLLDPELIHGMAHITGGGIAGNLSRVIPGGLAAHTDLSKILIPPIFKFIREFGSISDAEMLSTFNCGVGLIMVVPPERSAEIHRRVGARTPCYEIGTIETTSGNDKTLFIDKLNWTP